MHLLNATCILIHFVLAVTIAIVYSLLWHNLCTKKYALMCEAYAVQMHIPSTVEPPNRGHFGTAAFVLSSEVVLFSEVV